MPRKPRNAPGGLVYHVINRAAGRITLFRNDDDFTAFERILAQAHDRHPIDLFAYCLMPNHWHFLVCPEHDHDLTRFFRWLTHTHAMRWRVAHHTVGYGPLYQGRFKSFPVQCDHHLATVARYVERNPLTANLVRRAQDWQWSSLHTRQRGRGDQVKAILSDWPINRPTDWPRTVNAPLTPKELDRLQISESRSRPFGDDRWLDQTVARLSLQHTIRPEGRPRKPRDIQEKRSR
jgi:putative transposase